MVSQNHSLKVCNDQKNIDDEQTKTEVKKNFFQTEIATSSGSENPPKQILSTSHKRFRTPENFLNQPAHILTQCFLLKFHDTDKFSSERKDI